MTLSDSRSSSDIGPLRLSLWFGLVGGLGEVAVQRQTKHGLLLLGDDTVWMAPLAVSLFLLVVGLVLGSVQRMRHRNPTICAFPHSCFSR